MVGCCTRDRPWSIAFGGGALTAWAADDPVISTRGLAKRYGRSAPWVIQDVSLAIPRGSRTAIVGPNGVGKSTLLRCLIGFEKPSSGDVNVLGRDPIVNRSKVLADVAYVPQGTPLYLDLNVSDHLDLMGALRKTFSKSRAIERLHRLGIPLQGKLGRLSGGQRAQVSLTLALSSEASILLLDEPTSSLDPLARREFLTYASSMVSEANMTMLVATHIIGDLSGACDRIVVLAPRRVALDSATEDARSTHSVVDVPGDEYEVVGRVPRLDGTHGTLVRVAVGGDASLEDVVLGYLDAMRLPDNS